LTNSPRVTNKAHIFKSDHLDVVLRTYLNLTLEDWGRDRYQLTQFVYDLRVFMGPLFQQNRLSICHWTTSRELEGVSKKGG
jgi:hypothetical protein